MDDADGLMLNIASYDEGRDSEGDRGNKRKKWREIRLEQRDKRKESWLNPHLFTSKSEVTNKLQKSFPTNTKSSTAGAALKGKISVPQQKKPKQFQVVSSLFRHNPDIPDMTSRDKAVMKSEEQKEELFSGDKFSDLSLSPYMISNLENNMKLSTLTSVQKVAIPALLDGNDAFVKSNTGSGKTLAYAVPVIHSLQTIEPQITRQDGTYAVILVPTRELALQSFHVLQKLVKPFQWVVPGIVTGGEKRKSEKARLRKGINILVATPGRLLDHIEKTECLHLKKVRWIVLDEADRLLDMGFEKEVSAILSSIKKSLSASSPRKCQTVLLSATLTEGVERLVGVSLHEPVLVDVTATEDAKEVNTQRDHTKRADLVSSFKTPQNLHQFFIVVPSKLRLVTLAAFLLWKYKDSGKIIVFLASRDSVDFYSDLLSNTLQSRSTAGLKLKMFKLHGNMSQTERTEVFRSYAEVKRGILFCTDVAARGLDLPHVNWIIQYNTPGRPADYIHRVGRTARIGLEGSALMFLTPAEVEYLKILESHGISPKEMSVHRVLKSLVSRSCTAEPSKRRRKNDEDHVAREAATELQLNMEEYVLANKSHMQSAKTAFQSFVRSYATYPADLKHIFHIKNLHLGHVAKSFGLRDAPTNMSSTKKNKPDKAKKRENAKKGMKRRLPVMEHSSDKSLSGPLPNKRRKKAGLKSSKK